jgi:hypothetical protein
MNFEREIERNLFSRKPKDGLKAFHEIVYILGKELGWSPQDIFEAPTPLVLGVLEEIRLQYEREKKAMKKKK